ncbi:hypothetical protein MPL3356_340139 [Mesorhizobium plurifarium]|uniref:Uncharacterized protein n=1 Tax=Mesorhizobium plurifarium TaxID=69974 RepID=A0A090E1Q0_MESPL|nr:hypothetical protein MPL3356_340139 [Mesorhizobium plurifarium]
MQDDGFDATDSMQSGVLDDTTLAALPAFSVKRSRVHVIFLTQRSYWWPATSLQRANSLRNRFVKRSHATR